MFRLCDLIRYESRGLGISYDRQLRQPPICSGFLGLINKLEAFKREGDASSFVKFKSFYKQSEREINLNFDRQCCNGFILQPPRWYESKPQQNFPTNMGNFIETQNQMQSKIFKWQRETRSRAAYQANTSGNSIQNFINT